MEVIISNIKNIVIIIVASEFLKNFLIGDKFKKYITVCVNILVIGFMISRIKNVPCAYNFNYEISDYKTENYSDSIKNSYEQRVSDELKLKFEENKILVYNIEVFANADYSIKKINVYINGDKKTAEEILKGLKLENYEIIVDDR